MAFVEPVTLTRDGITLVPLGFEHEDGLGAAALVDDLWKIKVSLVPGPGQVREYIEFAHATPDRFAFAVLDQDGEVIGSTSYHDILPEPKRVEIGYTWYTAPVQRTHVNTTCKLLLLEHAFDTLGCNTVGLRTDAGNYRSQAAIQRLGFRKDGTIRGNALRRDGVTLRDTVMYSAIMSEWPAIRARLEEFLAAPRDAAAGDPAAANHADGTAQAATTPSLPNEPVLPPRANAGLSTTICGQPVQNIPEAVDFYCDRFGFTSPHQDAGFAVLLRDDARVHLWLASDERWRTRPDFATNPIQSGAESFLAGTAGVRIEVADVDALFAELQPRGVLHPNAGFVATTNFGTREFATLDHEGNLLEFYERVE